MRTTILAWIGCTLMFGCNGGGGGDAGIDGTTGNGAVSFAFQREPLPGFQLDTGYLPAMAPAQIRASVSFGGSQSVTALATVSNGTLIGTAGSGRVSVEVHAHAQLSLKLDVPLGPRTIHYEGPVMGAPDLDVHGAAQTMFDPFLVGGMATATATIRDTMLATIPLAGTIPLPGVEGNLVLSASGMIATDFAGTCAALGSDGTANYTGILTTRVHVVLRATVQLRLLSVMKTLGPFDVPFDVPAVASGITLTPSRAAAGTVDAGGGGSIAMAGTCAPPDAGPTDAGPNSDAMPDAMPSTLFAPCTTSSDCSSLGMFGVCVFAFATGICQLACSTDGDCMGWGPCAGGLCQPPCTSGGGQCERFGGVCSGSSCSPSCFPTGRMAPAGYASCLSSRPCEVYTGLCTDMPVTTGADTGAPCMHDADCRGGYCIPPTDAMGASTGFVGGYCTSGAREPAASAFVMGQPVPRSNCPPNSAVFPNGNEGDVTFCLASCTADTDCRNGYSCNHFNAPGTPPFTSDGVCFPTGS